MPEQGTAKFRAITFERGNQIVTSARVTRATVAAEFPNVPIGTMCLVSVPNGSTGRAYLKLTHTGAGVQTDWQVISTAASD